MHHSAELRQQLEARSFPDLGAMMEGYARAASDVAAKEFQQKLDFSGDSVDALDEVLILIGESPQYDLEFEVRLWGSYLGEVVRGRYAGAWEMYIYPGGNSAVPAVNVRGSRLFPLMKVYRRLTEGDEEDLRTFFSKVVERLGKPARVN
jgi:hypothetical protein